MEIDIQPFGDIDRDVLLELAGKLKEAFGCPVTDNRPLPVPEYAFTPARNQYLSDLFIDKLKHHAVPGKRILGITEADLYTRGLNFVFGQADKQAGVAVISLKLLRQEYYGLEEDHRLLMERALKEAVHEIGHTLGMDHCQDGTCVMHFSNSLIDTDIKKALFCPRCQPRLLE